MSVLYTLKGPSLCVLSLSVNPALLFRTILEDPTVTDEHMVDTSTVNGALCLYTAGWRAVIGKIGDAE